MTRTPYSYQIADLSGLARDLCRELAATTRPPGHLALMNMLARGAGFRNLQHFRAATAAGRRLDAPGGPTPDLTRVEQVLRYFDASGRLARWPARTKAQNLAIRAIWSHLPPRQILTEAEVNRLIDQWQLIGDRALLRRTLVMEGLLWRLPDGSQYRRIEAAPDPEALALIRRLPSP